MDNDDEVVCIGDLHKKNITGFKAWNLRRFALIGNNMVYYKKGVKRGEWDITGCTVRKMTAEECNSTATQFAFGIEGPKKQYLFSATSAKNRDLWIEIVDKQIDEFKNPIRKFLKRGEVIIGSGLIKRKNMFGKIPSNVIVTNFPRVLILDPATVLLKDQLNWVRGQSSFTKLDKSKFKLTINHKDINFEDPEGGTDMAFWEHVFHQLDAVELYAVTKKSSAGGIVKIGLPGSNGSSGLGGSTNTNKDHKQLKAEQNLIFLEEGASSIMQLLITLNTKIDALDLTLTQSIQHSDEWSINPDATQLYQDRLVKRIQLQMLKENIDMIAMNLEKLSVQTKKSPLTTSFDRVAIRNVIEEAGTLLALLNADDEDEDDDDKDSTMQFGDEVQHMDAQIAQMEEDNLATEEMIANVEFLSLFSDDSLVKLNEKFDSLVVDDALDMKVTSDNFNPDDISIRPPLWKEIRTKRLLIKEYVLKLEGCMEDSIIENRKNAVATEEVQMVQEVSTYGRLLNLASLCVKGGVEKAAMHITLDNFDPHSPDLRPPAWRPIRLRRVMVKEDFTGGGINSSSGAPPVSEAEIVRSRPRRVVEEEKVMIQEVLKNKQIISFGLPSENPERTSVFLTSEGGTGGGSSGNERVTIIRERANTLRDRAYTIRDKETIGGGRARVESAVPVYRGRASSTLAPITDFHISPDSFDPENEDVRPHGWMDVRMKRVMDKEELERLEGTDEESIILSRRKKLLLEEELMVQEVLKYGNVVGFVKPIKIVNSSALMAEAAEKNSADPPLSSAASLSGIAIDMGTGDDNISEEETEFNTTLMKRVLILEQKDREKGVNEEIIYSKRKQRESNERALMKTEIQKHGKILGVKEKEYGRRRAATILQDVTMIEINEENFSLANPVKRPNQWAEVRLKRVMLREHMDRITGGVEQSIMELRPLRETEEELAMAAEVVCFGRLLGVGETCKPSDQIASSLDVTPEMAAHYHPKDDNKTRPAGWVDIRIQRVALRELEERLRLKLRGGSDECVAAHKTSWEEEEEKAMIAEARKGPVSMLGTRSSGNNSTAEVDGVTKGVASVSVSSATSRTSTAQAASEAEDYERRRAELRRVERIEVTAKDLDGTHPDSKPAGWAEIKLRRVYLKEWQDRRDGLDEDEILGKRYERELEVEEEMTQVITVFGRIRLYENRIQTHAHGTAPLFPKDKDVKHKTSGSTATAGAYKPDTVSRAGSGHHTSNASCQLSASAMSMELLAGRLGQLAEDSGEADS